MAIAALAVSTLAVVTSVVGCATNTRSSTSSETDTSTTMAPCSNSMPQCLPPDYSRLLIKPSDISAPGDTFTAQPPVRNPNGKVGVATIFTNQARTRTIRDTVLVLPNAPAAAAALEAAKSTMGNTVSGALPEPAAVGSGGTMFAGTSPDGSSAVTVLVFTEGNAFTTLEFDSASAEPIPRAVVADVGQKQALAIKTQLGR